MKKILVSMALVATLSGCLSTAQNSTVRALSYQQTIKAVPVGSTKEHVRKTLGKPYAVNSFNGEEMWSYVDQKVNIGTVINPLKPWTKGFDTKGVIVRFNRSGRVKGVDQNTFNL